jgi:aminopeptidase
VVDERTERLAQVLVDYSTEVGEGDLVVVETSPLAAPLVRSLYQRVLEAGGHPKVRMALDGVAEALLEQGSDDQLEWVNPARKEDFERADARIAVEASWNSRDLTGIDPARQAVFARAREGIRERYLERSRLGELRSVVSAYPTHAAAQDAEMSLAQYEDFVFRAGFLDRDDPVAEWRKLGTRLSGLSTWLGERREIRVVSENTDLTLGVEGRTWIPCDGKENFPDGEVFTGPQEASVEGRICFTYPATFAGRLIRGVDLRFEGGEVVEAHAAEGQEFLREMLAMDDGARRVGEFAFGMNDAVKEFTGHTLYDEKIGGTVHLALGMSYPESGGLNQSALHWDLVCDLRSGGEVFADGEVVYRDGSFLAEPN